ncbi:MAG: radical SAM protein [Nanoarchaeota archaeon]|nr:radical SAM protein [Nanoarchaeota archaeon]MBU4351866.1 radical SAM protein [Nanoarchaeota archaeon]
MKTKYYSYLLGKMPKGCQMCVKGLKEVVFVTGVCSKKPCFFCPISDKKFGKDDIYANEWKVSNLNDLIKEAKLCSSKGAGLTGGDPLARLDRTIKIIKLLKKKFGSKFHIHLYTPLNLVTETVIKKLEKVGLDEIRFHPDLDSSKLWNKIKMKTKMVKGVEIPVIPGKEKQIKKLIDFIKDKVQFLNLNELELSDTNVCKLYDKGFIAKNKVSYAVKGSEALAKKLLKYCAKTKLNVHYCTVTLKDKVQLINRLKRRAKNVKSKFDYMTKEGTLVRGAIYITGFTPDLAYSKLDKLKNKSEVISKLKILKNKLMKEFNIPKELIEIDSKKLRLLTNVKVVSELKFELKKKKLYPAIVEELPSHDQFEIECEMV